MVSVILPSSIWVSTSAMISISTDVPYLDEVNLFHWRTRFQWRTCYRWGKFFLWPTLPQLICIYPKRILSYILYTVVSYSTELPYSTGLPSCFLYCCLLFHRATILHYCVLFHMATLLHCYAFFQCNFPTPFLSSATVMPSFPELPFYTLVSLSYIIRYRRYFKKKW